MAVVTLLKTVVSGNFARDYRDNAKNGSNANPNPRWRNTFGVMKDPSPKSWTEMLVWGIDNYDIRYHSPSRFEQINENL